MNKSLLLALLLLITAAGFAQSDKDSLVYNLPVVNGMLLYKDSVTLNNHSAVKLDSTAKKWFNSYFKYHQPYVPPKGVDTTNSVLSYAALEFKLSSMVGGIPFFTQIILTIKCKANNYTYKISDIYFRPENGVLNAIGYQRDPNYLIKIYKQKHLGMKHLFDLDRSMIRNYLSHLNISA